MKTKLNRQEQWEAAANRHDLRAEIEIFNRLLNSFNLKDAEDTAEIKRLLYTLRGMREQTQKYLYGK